MKETISTESGKKFRLVVRSAEEAVRIIREKLGENAKVLSVRQVGGEGLKRFVSSPKLEVIAQIVDEDGEEALHLENEDKGSNNLSDAKDVLVDGEIKKSADSSKSDDSNFSSFLDEQYSGDEKWQLLYLSGFDKSLLNSIQSWSNWSEICKLSLAEVLKEITIGLSDRFRKVQKQATSNQIAILGAPGVGKTTTLCKLLANEVFINKNSPNVLKVENGMPNPDDSLKIFCDVIGATLYREENRLPEVSDRHPLFLDFPGLSHGNLDDWMDAGSVLDRLNVKTRILVVNGAYEKEIINKEIHLARNLNATHLVVTHFDEMNNATKLWPLFFDNPLSPLCICNGQNVTGDFSNNVLNQLITKTFPEDLYARTSKYSKTI